MKVPICATIIFVISKWWILTPSLIVIQHLWTFSQLLRKKKNKYHEACNKRKALFTPLCTFVDGTLGKEAAMLVKHIAEGHLVLLITLVMVKYKFVCYSS